MVCATDNLIIIFFPLFTSTRLEVNLGYRFIFILFSFPLRKEESWNSYAFPYLLQQTTLTTIVTDFYNTLRRANKAIYQKPEKTKTEANSHHY